MGLGSAGVLFFVFFLFFFPWACTTNHSLNEVLVAQVTRLSRQDVLFILRLSFPSCSLMLQSPVASGTGTIGGPASLTKGTPTMIRRCMYGVEEIIIITMVVVVGLGQQMDAYM